MLVSRSWETLKFSAVITANFDILGSGYSLNTFLLQWDMSIRPWCNELVPVQLNERNILQ